MSTHAERIRGWSKAHPTKTATVEDILALRSNIVANLEQFAKGADDRMKRAEAAIKELNEDMMHNTEATEDAETTLALSDSNILAEVWRLTSRVEELERRTFSARWRRVREKVVAATWRLRLRFHREEETTTEVES